MPFLAYVQIAGMNPYEEIEPNEALTALRGWESDVALIDDLHGFFSASLILCRSCIESAIETKLDQKGLRKELDRLPFNKVQELLRLAVNSGVLDDLTRQLADEIRRSANKAVHGSAPSEAECRERLEQTRAVLRHIYE